MILLCLLPLVVAGTLISTTWCWHVLCCVFVSGGTESGSCEWEHDAVCGALALTKKMCFVFLPLFDFFLFLHVFCFSVFVFVSGFACLLFLCWFHVDPKTFGETTENLRRASVNIQGSQKNHEIVSA